MKRIGCGVSHTIEISGEAEAGERALTLRNSLDVPTRGRHPEQVAVAANVAHEVDELTVGAPGGRFGYEVPIDGQVLHRAAIRRDPVEIYRTAVILFRLDHLVETRAAPDNE